MLPVGGPGWGGILGETSADIRCAKGRVLLPCSGCTERAAPLALAGCWQSHCRQCCGPAIAATVLRAGVPPPAGRCSVVAAARQTLNTNKQARNSVAAPHPADCERRCCWWRLRRQLLGCCCCWGWSCQVLLLGPVLVLLLCKLWLSTPGLKHHADCTCGGVRRGKQVEVAGSGGAGPSLV